MKPGWRKNLKAFFLGYVLFRVWNGAKTTYWGTYSEAKAIYDAIKIAPVGIECRFEGLNVLIGWRAFSISWKW